ncbi:hypothetical protein PHET_01725 [Paragonimus heterotremus]|uniref:DUF5746 domain-containing protein n=1 Tax=Paragonimus heterotremus TaxID=100268 RepID=A0A8J4TM83_9TREM|nr:hypothetical protein PHET_01725 [Paragonimus heterotremus]
MRSVQRPTVGWTVYACCAAFVVLTVASLFGYYQSAYLTNSAGQPVSRLPTRCYTCDNYASVETGVRPGVGSGLAWLDGKPVQGGWSKLSSHGVNSNGLTAVQASRLCSERVNRTRMRRLIDSQDYGECPNANYDGCVKLVTKSYRVKAQIGVPVLSAVVVSRTCAIIPEAMGVGCFDSVGGAGMRRTICYCRGNFCNSARKHRLSRSDLLLIMFVIVCRIL